MTTKTKNENEENELRLAHDRMARRLTGIITAWRKRQGLTRAQFADVLGVNNSTVRKWEYDYHIPRQLTVLRITAVLDIDAADTRRLITFAKLVDDYLRRGEVFRGNMPEAVFVNFAAESDFGGEASTPNSDSCDFLPL